MKTDMFNEPASLPADLRLRMELSALLPDIRGFIIPTMRIATDRFLSSTNESGWVDMKFDPVNGKERDSSQEIYRKDRVYGWIQGRGLESMTAHIQWARQMTGYKLVDIEALSRCAETLYRKLMTACFTASEMQVTFIMDTAGRNCGSNVPGSTTTLTHLFVLRGLLAYASYRNYSSDLERIIYALRNAVDNSIQGLCLNDQVSFGNKGGERLSSGRKGYEGQMIAISACELLFLQTRMDEDLMRGIKTIESVFLRHSRRDDTYGLMLVDGIQANGQPYREEGRLATDPGHALEFVGLSLQFFRHSAPYTINADHVAAIDRMTRDLRSLAYLYNRLGRAPHGGIVKSINAENAAVINGDCPWWSSYEAVRTWTELHEIGRDDVERSECVSQIKSYVDCIRQLYVSPSSIGVPVQTVDYDGQVVPVIPATPDIDPGYHTGMPLINALELLGRRATMLCGLSEGRIPVSLGSPLQGHAARSGPSEREMDPLHVRCCWISAAREQVLLLSADVLEFSHEWSAGFAARISAVWGIPEDCIILLATHTHTAPCVLELGLLKGDAAFLSLLEQAFEEAIQRASVLLVPMVGVAGLVEVPGIGINRRRVDPATRRVSMRPNLAGERDDGVTSLFLFDSMGSMKGLLANMAVHPTTLSVSIRQISADYPGRMVRELKLRLGQDVVVIPIQGACGDIRPMVVDGAADQFREGSEQDIDRMGAVLASGVLESLDLALKKARWLDGTVLSFSTRKVLLPFHSLPVYEEVQHLAERTRMELMKLGKPGKHTEGFEASHENPFLTAQTYLTWAEKLLREDFDTDQRYTGKAGVIASFACWSLGPDLVFFTLPGEAFCRIGKALKALVVPCAAMVCGYCGGSVGYIPTSDAFREGGYEVEAAFRFYGYPAPLAADIEGTIIELYKSLRG